MRNRTVGINVRVTPAEKRRMASAARRCGLTLSEYLRQRALGYTPQFHPPASLFSALEELDALAGIAPDDYTDAQAAMLADVFYTLKEKDVAGWLRSLQIRRIELPEDLRDEALQAFRDWTAKTDKTEY